MPTKIFTIEADCGRDALDAAPKLGEPYSDDSDTVLRSKSAIGVEERVFTVTCYYRPKLRPCPFCGSTDIARIEDDNQCWVMCDGCSCKGPPSCLPHVADECWNGLNGQGF